MNGVAVVTGLALLECFVFGAMVGRARSRYHVEAPATTGDPSFERYFRVHQNSVESLVIFIPALWLFAMYVSSAIAVALGLIFIAGRIIYAAGYISAAEKREPGALISGVIIAILLIGAVFGPIVGHFRAH